MTGLGTFASTSIPCTQQGNGTRTKSVPSSTPTVQPTSDGLRRVNSSLNLRLIRRRLKHSASSSLAGVAAPKWQSSGERACSHPPQSHRRAARHGLRCSGDSKPNAWKRCGGSHLRPSGLGAIEALAALGKNSAVQFVNHQSSSIFVVVP